MAKSQSVPSGARVKSVHVGARSATQSVANETPAKIGGELVTPLVANGARRVPRQVSACVVGGGLAGVAAALVLAERGVSVTLIEAEPVLGGRVAAFDTSFASLPNMQVGRGFHAFFRQYYNVRRLLARLDPTLGMLSPMADYPLLGGAGEVESFAGLPTRTPFNLIELVRRTEHLTLRDLMRVNVPEALSMLTFDQEETYARYDEQSARSYLDSLNFPPRARAMLFNVFAHSFFNPEEGLSAAELLMMFHFYFTGNPDGLIFDVLNKPFSTGLWQPLARRLTELGVKLRLGTRAERVARLAGDRYAVECASERHESDWLVLALNVPALQQVVASSELDCVTLQHAVSRLSVTRPFVVWRMWLDRKVSAARAPFAGTTGLGALDNISLFEKLEDESRDWSEQTGGSVLELHAYAVEEGFDEQSMRAELWQAVCTVYPELEGARVLEECWFVRQDCPSFAPGSHAARPTVETALPGLTLAGDFVRLPFPSALMERAVSSGVLAANTLLASEGVESEPLFSVSTRGLLAAPKALRKVRKLLPTTGLSGATR